MEIKPVKSAQPPGYPIKAQVCAEQIKSAVPRRWKASRAAKAALAALTVASLAGCTTAKAVELSATPVTTAENTASQTTETPYLQVLAGLPKEPAIPVLPLFIAAAGILAAMIWFFRRKNRPKKENKRRDHAAPWDNDEY